jgi:hypothetical protein
MASLRGAEPRSRGKILTGHEGVVGETAGSLMGRRRVDLQTAAQLLGISSDAVRKRAKRGKIDYENGVDGKLYVWVDTGETEDYPSSEGTFPTERGMHYVQHKELVEELRARVRFLERQVEEERDANRENRRLLAAALERIPELEAPRGEPESSEGAGEEPTGTTPPPEPETTTSRERSWWRRFFGVE